MGCLGNVVEENNNFRNWNQYQVNQYQYQGNQYQVNQYQGYQYQGNQYQGNQYQGNQYQQNQYQQNQYQQNQYMQGYNNLEQMNQRNEEEERKRKAEEERRRQQQEEYERKLKQEEEERRKKEENERIKLEQDFARREEERIKKELQEKEGIIQEKIKQLENEYKEKEKKEEEEKAEKDEKEGRWTKFEKLGVDFHSQREIREKYAAIIGLKQYKDIYEIPPSVEPPYSSGKLSEETKKNALKLLNAFRFVAGIPDNVVNDTELEKLAQDSALLMRVNKKMSHFGQPKPPDMSEELYKSGADGCSTSNIAYNHGSIYKSIMSWVGDLYVTGLGHRRWALDPCMEKTGFGGVGPYWAMYAIEGANKETSYKNVSWPGTNMPIEFSEMDQWNISTGNILGDNSEIEVKITNNEDGKTYFYSEKDNTINKNDIRYGLSGCIMFKSPFPGKDKTSCRVDITGKDLAISYDVNFFKAVCPHDLIEIGRINQSCLKKGKLYSFCKICGLKVEKDLDSLEHEFVCIQEEPPNCIKKGLTVLVCKVCHIRKDVSKDFAPHDYEICILNRTTGEVQGTCKVCNNEIKIIAPTMFKVWWRKTDDIKTSFSSACPEYLQVGEEVTCWISDVNGDLNYRYFCIIPSDPEIIEVHDFIPDYDYEEQKVPLKAKKPGKCRLTVVSKYNYEKQKHFNITVLDN